MKVITNNSLKTDPKKPLIPANEEVDLPKKPAEELLESGDVRLPAAEVEGDEDSKGSSDEGTGTG